MVKLTAEEDGSEVDWMIDPAHRMSGQVIKIWLHDVLDIMEGVIHSTLKSCASIF